MSNHVSIIIAILASSQWRYVPTEENPAEHISRALLPKEIVNCRLWWEGPTLLVLPPSSGHSSIQSQKPGDLPEARVHLVQPVESDIQQDPPWQNFISYSHFLRVYSLVCRFLNNTRLKEI